jgi:ribosomal protein S18 acetylase RimI-like enzyme
LAEELDRIVAMSRWFEDVTATRSEAWRFGTAVFHDGFPDRWDSNFLRVERPIGDATADDLAAVADELLAHLHHRELIVEDGDDGARLAVRFRELGYEADDLASMVLRRERDRAPSLRAREVSYEVARPVVVAANLEGHGGMAPAVAEMLADFGAVAVERAGARFFVADVDGHPASYCELFVHEGAAQVENVSTLAASRNRGAARAVVSAAVEAARAAGADLIWLFADANDWPRQLYAKLGFDPLGASWQFTKPPAGSSYR